MSALMATVGFEVPPSLGRSDAQLVGQQIRLLLASSGPDGVERRRDQRFAFPQLVRLTPVDQQTLCPQGESLVVVGKHLSENGLGFYHEKPIADRTMLAVMEHSSEGPLQFLLDLSWCRFTRQGWYESGGRFLQAICAKRQSVAS